LAGFLSISLSNLALGFDESQISDDTLKNKCLTIKVTVQLEVLDITKLSPDVKSVENKAFL
jgi:hypothetical protein